MSIKWNKIKWDKIFGIIDNTINSEEDDAQTRFWLKMSDNSKMKLDKDGNLPEDFTWEMGYKANLPLESNVQYLCYFEDADYVAICVYDDEQDFEPLFWENESPCYPDYWAKVELPKRK